MKQDYCILIHYHEIALKGKNRSWFENQLINNIELQLSLINHHTQNSDIISRKTL